MSDANDFLNGLVARASDVYIFTRKRSDVCNGCHDFIIKDGWVGASCGLYKSFDMVEGERGFVRPGWCMAQHDIITARPRHKNYGSWSKPFMEEETK